MKTVAFSGFGKTTRNRFREPDQPPNLLASRNSPSNDVVDLYDFGLPGISPEGDQDGHENAPEGVEVLLRRHGRSARLACRRRRPLRRPGSTPVPDQSPDLTHASVFPFISSDTSCAKLSAESSACAGVVMMAK
jgi:hypothetical protein